MRISDWSSDVCSSDLARVGCRPGEADMGRIEDLHRRRLALDQQLLRQAARVDLHVVGDVLPPEAKVLGSEGLTVGPAVAGAQGEGEDALLLHRDALQDRSEEHTSELQSLMRISYAVFCLKKQNKSRPTT